MTPRISLNKSTTSISQALRLGLALSVFLALVTVSFDPQGYGLSPDKAHASFFNEDLENFEEVLELVAEKYVYPPDYRKLFGSVIDGMVKSAPENTFTLLEKENQKIIEIGKNRLHYQLSFSRQDNLMTTRKVYRFLLAHLDGQIKKTDLETSAIRGIMSSLDPYSLYLDPEEFENSMRDTEGQYGGLGMVITMEDYKLTVVKTMKGSPAERSGLLPGDIITHVETEEIKNMQIQELASRLRGYPDTQVNIRTLRPKTGEKFSYTMTRKIISIESVEFQWIDDDTAYIKVSSFSRQTNDQLEEALKLAMAKGMRALILDLRNNPGGLLNQSVLVSSHFLKEGKLIVYTRGRHVRDSQQYEAVFEDSLQRLPMAVLINHNSASASEIVAGSLRDSGRAILIGENSYGKGSVQTIFKMSDGSGLRLTTSKYFTPSGTDITEQGIVPGITIEQDLPPAKGEETPAEPPTKPSLLPSKGLKVKQSEVEQYLKTKGIKPNRELDSQVHLARMVLKNSKPTRSHNLAEAKKLVQDMHY